MARKKKIVQPEAPKSYRLVDKRGQQMSGLYPTPSTSRNPSGYRPRYYTAQDTPKAVTSYDRVDQLTLARSLFTECPDLGGALMQKASWVVGPGAFTPISLAENKEWADAAEEWLINQFYPICSVNGPNYPFTELLRITSLQLDIDGDTGLYFTTTRSGYPQVGLVPSHRIGCRGNEKEVKEGKFAGWPIIDGVIVNGSRPIGYRILGDTPDEDYDISVQNFQLLFESEWCDQVRGISRVARGALDWTDQADINEFIKRGAKIASSIGLISKTDAGNAVDAGANIIGVDEDTPTETADGLSIEAIHGGEILYMKSGLNETIEALKDDRPSQNTEAFISRIQKRAMYSIGWPQEMLDSSKIGGASVRLVQDLARKSVAQRQATVERRAKIIVNFAIAKAMNSGLIPQNNTDWFKWAFTRGGVLTVDNGNEAAADREAFKLGTNTLANIASKAGQDWFELREQQQRETEDLLTRARVISDKFKISMDAALGLLSQRAPNQIAVLQAPEQDNTQPTE